MRVLQAKLYKKIPQFFSNGGGGRRAGLGTKYYGKFIDTLMGFCIMFYLIVINQVFIYIQKLN